MQTVSHIFARLNRKVPFVGAAVIGALAMTIITAAAYYGATGTGTLGNIPAASQSSTVTLSGGAPTFTGPSATALAPGGAVSQIITITCTAVPPCVVSGISLQGWTSTKTGCDSTTLPGSFTLANSGATFPLTISTLNGTNNTDTATITFVNLPSVNQSACAGGLFSFTLSTP
jgi:hypothetical protein